MDSISKTPVCVAVIDLDYCQESFGVAPCTATGVNCYNTYRSCKDRGNFNKGAKQYYFCTHNVGTPLMLGERPYLLSIDYLPTEIKTSFTVSGRVKVKLLDEPDTDVGIDPYYTSRTRPIPGSFWKKLLARNPNYKGRPISIYEGVLGDEWTDYQLRFRGLLYNISIGKGQVTIEATDPLKSLADIYLPSKVEIKLRADIGSAETELPLIGASNLSTYTYFRIKDEFVSVNTYSSAQSAAQVSRGALGTTASSHTDNDKLTPVWVYGPDDPFTAMQDLLTVGEIPASSINTTAFSAASTWPATDQPVYCIIKEPTPVEQLYFELVDLCNCKSWYGEDQRITMQRQIPNSPGRTFSTISDAYNIIGGSASIDLCSQNHITRCALYWGQTILGEDEKSTSYNHLTISIDAGAESSFDYDEVLEKTIYSRWMSDTATSIEAANERARSYTGRTVYTNCDPRPIIQLDLDPKDSTIITGSYVVIDTDEIEDQYGDPVNMRAMVVRRENKGDRVSLRCQALSDRYIMLMASTTAGDWTAAGETERADNGYMSDAYGVMPDGYRPGYHMY